MQVAHHKMLHGAPQSSNLTPVQVTRLDANAVLTHALEMALEPDLWITTSDVYAKYIAQLVRSTLLSVVSSVLDPLSMCGPYGGESHNCCSPFRLYLIDQLEVFTDRARELSILDTQLIHQFSNLEHGTMQPKRFSKISTMLLRRLR